MLLSSKPSPFQCTKPGFPHHLRLKQALITGLHHHGIVFFKEAALLAGLQAIVQDCNAQLEAAPKSGADSDTLREELGDAEAELAILAESHDPQTLQDAAASDSAAHMHPGLKSKDSGPPDQEGKDPAGVALMEQSETSSEQLPGQSEALLSNLGTGAFDSKFSVFC
jgi:hypothetical protein